MHAFGINAQIALLSFNDPDLFTVNTILFTAVQKSFPRLLFSELGHVGRSREERMHDASIAHLAFR